VFWGLDFCGRQQRLKPLPTGQLRKLNVGAGFSPREDGQVTQQIARFPEEEDVPNL
jgi:hypothetical protein